MQIYSSNLKDELVQRGWKPRAHIEYWIFDDEAQAAVDEIKVQEDDDFLSIALRLMEKN